MPLVVVAGCTPRVRLDPAPNFEKAEPCYVLDQKALLQRIDMIRASDLPEDRKVRLAAAKEKEIAAARFGIS
jgi:hypothetical protein